MRSKKLFLMFRQKSLHALLSDGKKGLSYQNFSMRETSKESLSAHLIALRREGAAETVLVLPREEILSQDFEASSESDSVKKEIRQKLEKSFPYRMDEMSYGVRLAEENGHVRGTVLVTTGERLAEAVGPIEAAGLKLEDVTTTDETLLGYYLSQKPDLSKRALLCDWNEAGLECLFIDREKVVFSRVFSSFSQDLLREIGILTIDSGGCEKIYICGKEDASFDEALRNQFQVPLERWKSSTDTAGRVLPLALYGAAVTGRRLVSLLPVERKIKRNAEKKKAAMLAAAGAFVLCVAAMGVLFFAHLKAMEWKLARFDKKLETLGSEFQETGNKSDALKKADETFRANSETLSLFKSFTEGMPARVRLSTFEMTKEQISFQGESPDNAAVAEALAVVKGLKGVADAKLEYSKRQIQDEGNAVYEFLIRAELR